MTRVILVPYDQLSRRSGALGAAVPGRDEILLVESDTMLRSRPWHAQRLFLILSSAAHLAADLRQDGFTVHERQAATVADGVTAFRADRPDATIVATEPRSRPLQRALKAIDVDLVPDTSFLTSRSDFAASMRWAM